MSAAPYRATGKRFGVIGQPVGHSVSPAMMQAAFEAMGLPHSYEAMEVAKGSALSQALAGLRAGVTAGLNVTVPHKRAACLLADDVAESARRCGAANVLVRGEGGRIRAENTDAAAIVRVLGASLSARRSALILGSGGAARAAMIACEELGFRAVEITSRSWTTPEEAWERGKELPEIRARVTPEPWAAEWGEASLLGGRETDLVIQATSAGMAGADPGEEVTEHVAWDALPAGAVAFDVVYRPRVTPFLEMARRRKLSGIDGLGMLVEQAALALTLWLGVDAPRDVMLAAASEALRS
jgi:shikimate dehydrogenase